MTSLTGTPLYATAIALTVIAVLLPLLLWSRVRGPAAVRGLVRCSMVVFAQVTAIALVFVAVNRSENFYASWDDLLGTGDYVVAAHDLGPDGLGGRKAADLPRVRQEFRPDGAFGGRVLTAQVDGTVSGVQGDVHVWLPPQYEDPAWKDRRFPVVELIPGMPGTGTSWFQGLKVHEVLEPLMKSGKIPPFVLVSARTMLLGGTDTGCANIPGKVNADSWLSVDVRRAVTDTFRVSDRAGAWGVSGYSAGGHCAARLAIAHPDRYAAAVSLSGYNDPAQEPTSLVGRDPELRRSHNLLTMLTSAATPPPVALWLSGAQKDGYEAGQALARAAHPPTVVHAERVAGGHNIESWVRQIPRTFAWLGTRLKAA
ncbi:esterase [Streptomyces venezuelae]|uniref:Esterase n=1 Tax=Streptomyces venezuelae TaxID=54571 RepID=A0A5P2D3J1_STRVZ|nr:alpha/beta hydrolase-fold protein [Streptomyces venezuelae]QES49732.1 esterase [Streptomyces venezuelae]